MIESSMHFLFGPFYTDSACLFVCLKVHKAFTKNVHDKKCAEYTVQPKRRRRRTKHIRCTTWHLYIFQRIILMWSHWQLCFSLSLSEYVCVCLHFERKTLENAHRTHTNHCCIRLLPLETENQCAAIEKCMTKEWCLCGVLSIQHSIRR